MLQITYFGVADIGDAERAEASCEEVINDGLDGTATLVSIRGVAL